MTNAITVLLSTIANARTSVTSASTAHGGERPLKNVTSANTVLLSTIANARTSVTSASTAHGGERP